MRRVLGFSLALLAVGGIAAVPAFLALRASPTNGPIDAQEQYAWGNVLGWVNFGTPGGNVRVTDAGITGYAWSANYGWINLNPPGSGVTNDAEGTLAGSAWGEHVGWIHFDGVTIGTDGRFAGYAALDGLGSLSMNCANTSSCGESDFKVRTEWRPASVRTGGGGGSNNPPPNIIPGGVEVDEPVCVLAGPNGGETYVAGGQAPVGWTSGGPGIVNVALGYSTDGGDRWTLIEASVPHTSGSYLWRIPEDAASDTVRIRVECRDAGSATVASSMSEGTFRILPPGTPLPEEEVEPPEPEPPVLPPEVPAVPNACELSRAVTNAYLPYGLQVDDIIKLADDGNPATWEDSVVYHVGVDGQRHPFPDARIFSTWHTDFSRVKIVPRDVLNRLPLGRPVLVRPGTLWIKMPSDAKTYLVEPEGYILRWIVNEDVAARLAGPQWNQNIIDVDERLFNRFQRGDDVTMLTLETGWPTGSLVRETADGPTWYVNHRVRRLVTVQPVNDSNGFQTRFIRTTGPGGWQRLPESLPVRDGDEEMLCMHRGF